jgi:hypothetical protein
MMDGKQNTAGFQSKQPTQSDCGHGQIETKRPNRTRTDEAGQDERATAAAGRRARPEFAREALRSRTIRCVHISDGFGFLGSFASLFEFDRSGLL